MTANNQYFERNMLINAQKTNIILESDNWGPKTELATINHFLDSSAAVIDQQIIINNTLSSLLANNDGSFESIKELNAKLAYQNTRPIGIGSDDIWLPTQLLMDIKTALALQTEVQAETGIGGVIDVLKDISRNTGFQIPDGINNVDETLEDMLGITGPIVTNLHNDTDGEPWLQTVNTTLSENLHDSGPPDQPWLQTIYEVLGITGPIVTNLHNGGEPWLETVNTTLSENLRDSGPPDQSWLQTIHEDLLDISGHLLDISLNIIEETIVDSSRVWLTKKSYSNTLPETENWVQNLLVPPLGDDIVEGRWYDPSWNRFPPKKFVLFLEISLPLTTAQYVNLFSQGDPGMGWFLRDRFVLQDFNPAVNGSYPFGTHVKLSRTYDWMGEYMKIDIVTGAPGKKIVKCYAQGI